MDEIIEVPLEKWWYWDSKIKSPCRRARIFRILFSGEKSCFILAFIWEGLLQRESSFFEKYLKQMN